MKCDFCLDRLEEYFDGELAEVETSQVGEHLITCSSCSAEFATLTADHELFARYDRDIEVPPMLWNSIAAQTTRTQPVSNNGLLKWFTNLSAVRSLSYATVVAVLLLAVLIGVAYLGLKSVTRNPVNKESAGNQNPPAPKQQQPAGVQPPADNGPTEEKRHEYVVEKSKHKRTDVKPQTVIDQSDVISTDLGFDPEDEDTAKHLEQTQNLLRSIRNVRVSDGDDEVDVSYDKALSRRLLNENVVLRRDAEMKAKYPTKSLLSDVEPFLIDIANLPDRARPDDVRTIQERVEKAEIVAALSEYQGRGTDR